MPYENKNDGLFEVKESFNDNTAWSGLQTMVTPKGRETFRLLYPYVKEHPPPIGGGVFFYHSMG